MSKVSLIILFTLFFSTESIAEGAKAKSGMGTSSGSSSASSTEAGWALDPVQTFNRKIKPLVTGIDYHTRMIYIFDYSKDAVVIVNPQTIQGWPGDIPLQHTVVSADGKTLYVTTDNTPNDPAYLVTVRIKRIRWKDRTASLKVEKIAAFDEPNTPAELPFVEPVNSVQAVPGWLQASGTQIHGPTRLPYSDYIYFTSWTNDKVRVWNSRSKRFAKVDPIQIEGYTEQTHGVVFNRSGTLGLGSGYFFDNNVIDLYTVDRKTGQLKPERNIKLGDDDAYAAFSHYVYWLDERYAVTATMQFDKTSLTSPSTDKVIPPSCWLIDAWEGTATQMISATNDVDGEGIFRSASDLAVIGNKIYFAEEDTIDYKLGEDGYISVFDISDIHNPQFIKRFRPGVELPEGFSVAHSLTPTPDNRYLMVASWFSGYVVKIDTLTDTVVKIFGPEDGLVMPHGLYAAGNRR